MNNNTITKDPKLNAKIEATKQAFAKWEQDKQKGAHVNPAKNQFTKLSTLDKTILVLVAIYCVWVVTTMLMLKPATIPEYQDSPILPTNTENIA